MNGLKNIFSNIPKKMPDEIFQAILSTDKLKIERIISKGHASPELKTNPWVNLLNHD